MKLNEDAIGAVLYENRVKFNQYGIDPDDLSESVYVEKLLKRLDQISYDVDEERTNSEVFRAAVRAIGSSNRKWTTFLRKEERLAEVLGGYEPAAALTLEAKDILEFFPGQSAAMHSQKVLEWAEMLADDSENYYASLRQLGETFRQRAGGDLSVEEQMICILTQLSDGPTRSWDGPRLKKWPGMGYAIGAEFMRTLGWDGFKPDRHIERLLDAWAQPVVEAQRDRAVELVRLAGRRAESVIKKAQYSLAGLAITPEGGSASRADNLLWLLGSQVVPSGDEKNVDRWTYFTES